MRRVLATTAAAVTLAGVAVAAPATGSAAPAASSAAPTSSVAVRAAAAPTVAVRGLDRRTAATVRASRSASRYRWTTVSYAKWFASRRLASTPGWGSKQMSCLSPMWAKESEWRYRARSSSGKYLGIPQTTSSEIKRAGYTVSAFVAYPEVQVLVGLRYIKSRYGSPCRAWRVWQSQGWY